MEPSFENVELHIHFTESGPARLTGGPLRRAPFLASRAVRVENGALYRSRKWTVSVFTLTPNKSAALGGLSQFSSDRCSDVASWTDLGRSDTQPQHGVNKRQLLRREWCRELLDKVFRTHSACSHTQGLRKKHWATCSLCWKGISGLWVR